MHAHHNHKVMAVGRIRPRHAHTTLPPARHQYGIASKEYHRRYSERQGVAVSSTTEYSARHACKVMPANSREGVAVVAAIYVCTQCWITSWYSYATACAGGVPYRSRDENAVMHCCSPGHWYSAIYHRSVTPSNGAVAPEGRSSYAGLHQHLPHHVISFTSVIVCTATSIRQSRW